ncbi:MAG TPA: hypothetical protein VL201_01725 [Patescibacteria group bacterium]|jgi:hypothetical protein|nr:hypothetical protein [Patescibacteria group bacterium]
MLYKKRLVILSLVFSIVLVANTFDNKNSGTILTLEEVEQLIKDIEKDAQLAKNIFPKAHTKKGLEKIIECINNFDGCDHLAILGSNNKEHKNFIKTINNASLYASQVKNEKSDLENKIDFIYEDLYEQSFYNATKKNVSFNWVVCEYGLRFCTMNFYLYLHGYLQKKRSIQK